MRRTDVEITVDWGQFSIKWFPLESMFMEQNLQVKALPGLDNRNQRKWKDGKGKIAENLYYDSIWRSLWGYSSGVGHLTAYGGVCSILKDFCVIFHFKVHTHQRYSEVELMNQGVYYNQNLIINNNKREGR